MTATSTESIRYLVNHRPVNWSKKLDQMAKAAGLRCSQDRRDVDHNAGDIWSLIGRDYAQHQTSSDDNGLNAEDVPMYIHAQEILRASGWIKVLRAGHRPNINKDADSVIDFLEERVENEDALDDLTPGQKTLWRLIRRDFRAWNNR